MPKPHLRRLLHSLNGFPQSTDLMWMVSVNEAQRLKNASWMSIWWSFYPYVSTSDSKILIEIGFITGGKISWSDLCQLVTRRAFSLSTVPSTFSFTLKSHKKFTTLPSDSRDKDPSLILYHGVVSVTHGFLQCLVYWLGWSNHGRFTRQCILRVLHDYGGRMRDRPEGGKLAHRNNCVLVDRRALETLMSWDEYVNGSSNSVATIVGFFIVD